MEQYTIHCTPEQTRKALELGAPIMGLGIYNDNQEEIFLEPTAEQLIGWLEGQRIFVHIEPCFDINCSWHIASKGYNKYGYTSDIKVCKTRKEATLTAIDFALNYLKENK